MKGTPCQHSLMIPWGNSRFKNLQVRHLKGEALGRFPVLLLLFDDHWQWSTRSEEWFPHTVCYLMGCIIIMVTSLGVSWSCGFFLFLGDRQTLVDPANRVYLNMGFYTWGLFAHGVLRVKSCFVSRMLYVTKVLYTGEVWDIISYHRQLSVSTFDDGHPTCL